MCLDTHFPGSTVNDGLEIPLGTSALVAPRFRRWRHQNQMLSAITSDSFPSSVEGDDEPPDRRRAKKESRPFPAQLSNAYGSAIWLASSL